MTAMQTIGLAQLIAFAEELFTDWEGADGFLLDERGSAEERRTYPAELAERKAQFAAAKDAATTEVERLRAALWVEATMHRYYSLVCPANVRSWGDMGEDDRIPWREQVRAELTTEGLLPPE